MNVLFNKELMLDDLVYCRTLGRVVRVVGLLPYDGYNKVVVNAGGLLYKTFQAKFLEPIPLTAEILERNGFVCKGSWCIEGNDLGLKQIGDSWALLPYYADYDAFCFTIISYVHELQNTIRLCGVDKEIVVTEDNLPKLGKL